MRERKRERLCLCENERVGGPTKGLLYSKYKNSFARTEVRIRSLSYPESKSDVRRPKAKV